MNVFDRWIIVIYTKYRTKDLYVSDFECVMQGKCGFRKDMQVFRISILIFSIFFKFKTGGHNF